MKWIWSIIACLIALGLYLQDDGATTHMEPTPATEKQETKTPAKKLETTIKVAPPKPKQKASTSFRKATVLAQRNSTLGKDFVPFDDQGNRYITQIQIVGKHLVYHGDVLLGKSSDLPKFKSQKAVKQGPPRKWVKGRVPFVVDDSLPNYDQVIDAIDYMNTQTNLNLVPRANEKDFLHFTFGESDCYSYAGRIGGEQEIYLTPRCGLREVLHEIMHSVGFFHEQNREDRDAHIRILWENIDPIHHTQFKKIPNKFLGLGRRPFDITSIMMYSSFTFSQTPDEPVLLTSDNDVVPQRQSLLSEEDISRVNIAYPLQ